MKVLLLFNVCKTLKALFFSYLNFNCFVQALKNMQTEYDRTVEDLVQKTDELETVRLQLRFVVALARSIIMFKSLQLV